MTPNRVDWLRVAVRTPLFLLGGLLSCGALALVGYVGPRLLSAALQFASEHPWVLVLIALGLVVWIVRAAGKDNPTW